MKKIFNWKGVNEMRNCLLGLDMGSTNTKAIAIDLQGRQIAYASRKTLTFSSKPGYFEYDLEQMWQNVLNCIKEVVNQLEEYCICAIGVSSLGETNVLIDRDGKPLHRAIAWFDQRAVSQTKRIAQSISGLEVHRITGQHLSPKFGLPKLLWTAENHPHLLRHAAHFMAVEDFILYRLCGKVATDYSIASRSLCFDINSNTWSQEILNLMHISSTLFPSPYPGGSMVGTLLPEVAQFCGMPSGTPVCTGGHDHACALFSSGAYTSDDILDSTGTAETIICACSQRIRYEQSYHSGICYSTHFGKRLYRAIMSSQACGASIEWFLRTFGVAQRHENKYSALFEEASSVQVEDIPVYVPYLRGLQENASAAGAFVGLRDAHGQSHLARALIEGICFAIRDRLDSYEEASHANYSRILVVGGLAQSSWFLQLKSNIMERKIAVPDCTEAAARGAAMLGGIGIGLLNPDNIKTEIKHSFEPDNDLSVYQQRHTTYMRAARFCSE